MKVKYKGFTLIEITLAIVLISILLFITTPLVSNVVARNDVLAAHESLYNALLRAQQLSKNQYKNAQWRVCLDNINKKYTVTSGNCSDPTNAETIKISSNITISSDQTLDILFKAISGELDNISNSITITLTGGGASKSIKINPSGVIDKEANITSGSTTTIPSIVTNGLVLHLDAGNINSYPGLNGTGNNWLDISGNNNNGTLVNGVGYNSANGGSLSFDGVNDSVGLPANTLAFGTGQFSIEAWVNASSFVTNSHIYSSQSSNQSGFINISYNTTPYNGFIICDFNGSTRVITTNNTTVSLNTWYHLVGLKNSSNQYIMYVNTISSTINNTSTTSLTATDPKIGVNPITSSEIWNGRISNFRIYNRALTAAEIQQNFNATRGRFGL